MIIKSAPRKVDKDAIDGLSKLLLARSLVDDGPIRSYAFSRPEDATNVLVNLLSIAQGLRTCGKPDAETIITSAEMGFAFSASGEITQEAAGNAATLLLSDRKLASGAAEALIASKEFSSAEKENLGNAYCRMLRDAHSFLSAEEAASELLSARLRKLYAGKDRINSTYRSIIDALSIAYVLKTKGEVLGDDDIVRTSVREGSKPPSSENAGLEDEMIQNATNLLISNAQLAIRVLISFPPKSDEKESSPDDGECFKAVSYILLKIADIPAYLQLKRDEAPAVDPRSA
jgi:hypothetical protein